MTVLPNMRLLGLPSSEEGRDWADIARRIDQKIEVEGYDLAEETTLVDFRDGVVRVFRPVIGGLKELGTPWLLIDLTSAQVPSRTLDVDFWDDVLEEIEEDNFTVMLKRRYEGELRLSVEVFFSFF